MEWNTVMIMITVIGCFLGLAGWLSTRDKKIAGDGEWRGTINAKLDVILGIDGRVKAMERDILDHEGRLCSVEGSTSSAHKRLDSICNSAKN